MLNVWENSVCFCSEKVSMSEFKQFFPPSFWALFIKHETLVYPFPQRTWILIRTALQTAVFLCLLWAGAPLGALGPVSAALKRSLWWLNDVKNGPINVNLRSKASSECEPQPQMCFLISSVWMSAVAPWCNPFSCKRNVSLLIWVFMWRLTAQNGAHVCRAVGSMVSPVGASFHSQVSFFEIVALLHQPPFPAN